MSASSTYVITVCVQGELDPVDVMEFATGAVHFHASIEEKDGPTPRSSCIHGDLKASVKRGGEDNLGRNLCVTVKERYPERTDSDA